MLAYRNAGAGQGSIAWAAMACYLPALINPGDRAMSTPKKLYIKTYGCQMNVYDLSLIHI